jgi:hypothetical protein
VKEVWITSEMVEAGVESMTECESAGADAKTTVIQMYWAMEAVRQMILQNDSGNVH